MEHKGIKPKNHDADKFGTPTCRWADIVTKQLSYDGSTLITYNEATGNWEYTIDSGLTWYKITGLEATPSESGLLSAADKAKLDSIENGATPGGGDMLKSQYDTDNNGQVDNADSADYATNSGQLNGQPHTYYTNAGNLLTGNIPRARLGSLYRDNTSNNEQSPFLQTGQNTFTKTPGTTVTFDYAYTEAPRLVFGSFHVYGSNNTFIDIITTTSFTAFTSCAFDDQNVCWMAIGKKT